MLADFPVAADHVFILITVAASPSPHSSASLLAIGLRVFNQVLPGSGPPSRSPMSPHREPQVPRLNRPCVFRAVGYRIRLWCYLFFAITYIVLFFDYLQTNYSKRIGKAQTIVERTSGRLEPSRRSASNPCPAKWLMCASDLHKGWTTKNAPVRSAAILSRKPIAVGRPVPPLPCDAAVERVPQDEGGI